MKQMCQRVGTSNIENVATVTRSLSMVVTGTNMRGLFTSNKNLMGVGFVTEPLDTSVLGPDTKRRTINGEDRTTLAHTDIDPSTTLVILLLLLLTLPLLSSIFHLMQQDVLRDSKILLWQKALPVEQP